MILAERLLHVFHWPAAYPIRLLLPTMIVLSLLLHAAALYLVRSTAPGGGAVLPPLPAKVVLWPGAAGDSVLLAARDPAWLQPGRLRDRLLPLPQVERPARALQPALPPLVDAPVEERVARWVPALPPLAVQPRFEVRGGATGPGMAPLTARFDGAGPAVTDDLLNRLRTAAPAQPPAAATELLVVVDAAGEPRHVWLVRGSGDSALDAAAQRAVQRSRFGPSEGLYRGLLRIVWAPGGVAP
jgi:TonB family protein